MIGTKWTHHWSFSIWRVLWAFVSPALLIAVVIFSFFDHKGLESNGYVYPFWANFVGNILVRMTLTFLDLKDSRIFFSQSAFDWL